MNTRLRRAYQWWDKLTITQKVWYGQMYSEYTTSREMILKAFDDYCKAGSHLRIVE